MKSKHQSGLQILLLGIFACTILVGSTGKTVVQTGNEPENSKNDSIVQLSTEERKLYTLINEYRQTQNLPVIPLSKSLTFVAQQHCLDLYLNKPDLKPGCNAHSWSSKGDWTACCYTADHAKASCIWDKPKELTNYPGYGFEIACGSSDPKYKTFEMTAEYALKSWQGSPGHNNVLVNKMIWKDYQWNSIGIGIHKGFACVWVGSEVDPEGTPD